MRSLGFLIVLSTVFYPIGFAAAQQFNEEENEQEGETLAQPVEIPHNKGIYRDLDQLPENIRKSKQFARDMYLLRTRVVNDTEYNYKSRIDAHAFAKQQVIDAARNAGKGQKSPLADAWTNVGPGGATTTGGMTSSIVINPKQPNTVYAGAAGGGVWKSYNAGQSWFPLTDDVIPDLAIGSIAIDPVDTNTLYVGSGNPFSAVRGLGGSGVYKTTDGGATWSRIGASSISGSITKVFVHPKQPNIVFACGYDDSRGIFRSTDKGATWTKVLTLASGRAWDITPALVVNTDVVLYTVIGNGTSSTGGVYKSIDNGKTWSKITNGGLPDGSQIGKAAIGISPKNTDKVWILMSNSSGDMLGLYRSTNAGVSFTKNTNLPNTVFKPSANIGAQGWYDLFIGVTPNSNVNDTVVVGGIEGWYSHNSGEDWTMFAGYADLPASAPHVDLHCIAFHPNISQRMFLGCDGGIYYSTNGGKSWVTRVNNYITHRYYRLGLQYSDSKVTWTGAQDQGIWKHLTGSTTSFRGLGDGFQVAVNPQNPNEVLALGPNGDLYRSTVGGTISSFVPVGASTFNDQADWDAPLKITNKSPYTRYLGRVNLWKSTDGQNWAKTTASPSLGGSPIRSIGINPYNNNVIWVGTYDKVAVTTNGGTNWTDKSSGIPAVVVTSIQLTGSDEDFAVVSLAAQSTGTPRVMVTTNGGTNWTNVSGTGTTGLPGAVCWSIALDSLNPKSIWYAATDFGMYYTRDAGKTWSVAGSGIGLTPCWDVALHPNKATLRVATFGRGLWEANTNVLPVELSSLSATPRDVQTELHWTTDSEHNSWRFYVRRSFNNEAFEEIGYVDAAGTSNTRRYYSFNDTKVEQGSYTYQLRTVDLDGSESFSNYVEVHRGGDMDRLRLDQNFPNPFLKMAKEGTGATPTRIRYYLPKNDHVALKIFNAQGQLMQTLVNEDQDPGEHNIFWNGQAVDGSWVAAGTYFYMLETGSGEQLWNKMIVLE